MLAPRSGLMGRLRVRVFPDGLVRVPLPQQTEMGIYLAVRRNWPPPSQCLCFLRGQHCHLHFSGTNLRLESLSQHLGVLVEPCHPGRRCCP